MTQTTDQPAYERVFVVQNPVAGSTPAEEVRQTIEHYFDQAGYAYHIHETSKDEALAPLVQQAVHEGYAMVVAVGGDGTVGAVASALAHTDVPLGILPAGTANVLARELGIPPELAQACALLAGSHTTTAIDGMIVGEQRYFLRIGVGLDSLAIRDTSRENKRRFGSLAYLWSGLAWLSDHQPVRFTLVVDGQRHRPKAAQVSVVNGGLFGVTNLRWAPDIALNDGRIEVCVVRAGTLVDYFATFWRIVRGTTRKGRRIKYYTAHERIVLQADKPLPIQADGEVIEGSPLQIDIDPGSVRVIVPAPEDTSA